MNSARQVAMDLVFGRWRSQIAHAGVKLGILDCIGDGRRKAGEVATQRQLHPAMTYRLMRALACIGLLREELDGEFAVTELGALFRADHPQSMRAMTLLEEGPQLYSAWSHLCEIVTGGGPNGLVREYGRPAFELVAANPEFCEIFNEAMSGYSLGETDMVLEALAGCDFSGVGKLCDIGGGHGHLLCSLLKKIPHLKGVVCELPGTIARPELLWGTRMGLGERCEYLAGDFFEGVPAADAYLLKHILHDWDDAECARILTRMHEASAPGARAFVVEFVVTPHYVPHFAKLMDIHMMCATSGRERTEQEFADLFASAGWKYKEMWRPASGLIGVLEADRA